MRRKRARKSGRWAADSRAGSNRAISRLRFRDFEMLALEQPLNL
jgi:hypothetical protein